MKLQRWAPPATAPDLGVSCSGREHRGTLQNEVGAIGACDRTHKVKCADQRSYSSGDTTRRRSVTAYRGRFMYWTTSP